MSKIILEFDAIEEYIEAKTAIQAPDWKIAMFDLDEELRKTTKYGQSILNGKPASKTEIKIAEKYRDKIQEILEQYSLKLNE
jgi:cellulose biosynthesis protein BcsQ